MNRRAHPRIACVVEGCKRGTTRFPPLEDGRRIEFICGEHWRRIPSSWRKRLAMLKRRATMARKRGDHERAERIVRAECRAWARCKSAFDAPPVDDELPAGLAMHLADLGL